MQIVTIQDRSVVKVLNYQNIHYARNTDLSELKVPYKYMKDFYKWNHSPVFGCVVGRRAEFYGATIENSAILTLNVPDNVVKLQSYYDWIDVLFYMENPKKWTNTTDFTEYTNDVLNGKFTDDPSKEIQATLPYILPEWLESYKILDSKSIKQFIDNNSEKVLKLN